MNDTNEENGPLASTGQTEATEQSGIIGTGRLEAFSDGVLAVIITIMVLELGPPHGSGFADLLQLGPHFLIYLLSFTFIAIYWNNHHHLLRATRGINASVMWANMHLLFWISLIPLVTAWAGDSAKTLPLSPAPPATFGLVGLLAGVAYYLLQMAIKRANKESNIVSALGVDFKGKISPIIYATGVLLSFIPNFGPYLAYAAYATVSIIWFIPDRRLAPR